MHVQCECWVWWIVANISARFVGFVDVAKKNRVSYLLYLTV